MRRVEWIGAITPLQDEAVTMRKMHGLYTPIQLAHLTAVEKSLMALVRQPGARLRIKTPDDGYSQEYSWGPWRFVTKMTDKDADWMFKNDRDEAEFRDLDNPKHDNRVAEVPWRYVTDIVRKMIDEARNGPQPVLVASNKAFNSGQVDAILNNYSMNKRAELEDRGVPYDPNTLKILRNHEVTTIKSYPAHKIGRGTDVK